MEMHEIPIANPVVVLREEFDDWAILFNPDTAAAVGINPVGVHIWKTMDGTTATEQIAMRVAKEYHEVPDTYQDEIKSFVEELTELGFVAYEL